MTSTKVLIVDDNEMNTALAKMVLQAGHFEVETASNALEAPRRVASFQPELILMDIQMPGMDGLELTRLLKADAQTRNICVVAFTAFAMRGDEAKCGPPVAMATCPNPSTRRLSRPRFGPAWPARRVRPRSNPQ